MSEFQQAAEDAVTEVTVTFYRSELTSTAFLDFSGPGQGKEVRIRDRDGLVRVLGHTDRDEVVRQHVAKLEAAAEVQKLDDQFESRVRGMVNEAALPSDWQDMSIDAINDFIRAQGQEKQRLGVGLIIERGRASSDPSNPEIIRLHTAVAGGAGNVLDVCTLAKFRIAAGMSDAQASKLDIQQLEVEIGGGMSIVNQDGETVSSGAQVIQFLLDGGIVCDKSGSWYSVYDRAAASMYICSDHSREDTVAAAGRDVFLTVARKAIAEFLGA